MDALAQLDPPLCHPQGHDPQAPVLRTTKDGAWLGSAGHAMWRAKDFAEHHAGVPLAWTEIDDGDEYCHGIFTATHRGHVYRIEYVRARSGATAKSEHLAG